MQSSIFNRARGNLPLISLFLGMLAILIANPAKADPTATPPYTVAVFASAPAGLSQPDSIVKWHDSIIVGYENHAAKDGSAGSSTLVEYNLKGKVKHSYTVQGHNDGLRIVGENHLWALQNEDANPTLVVIDLRWGTRHLYKFPPTPHGGGYDDIVVKNDSVYLTASNPNLNAQGVNVFPALVRATLAGDSVILETVFDGDAPAVNITTGARTTLNLTDPDSMTVDPSGNIVFVSQADSELIFVRHPFRADQTIGLLPLSAPNGAVMTIDDTAFAPAGSMALLVTDVGTGVIYRIERPSFGFEIGTAYSASDTLGLVGTLNVDSGFVSPIVTGMNSARGLVFLTSDEDHEEHKEE